MVAFCRKWHIRELSLFGSAVRGELGPDSDLDFLVSFEPGVSLSLGDLVDMKEELQERFGHPVDLVEKEALSNPWRRRSILVSCEVIYVAGPAGHGSPVGHSGRGPRGGGVYTGAAPESMQRDRMLRNAVERNLEIIGEASRRLSERARAELDDLPWRSIIGLRNILAHEYDNVRSEILWSVCCKELPDLIRRLGTLGVDTTDTDG